MAAIAALGLMLTTSLAEAGGYKHKYNGKYHSHYYGKHYKNISNTMATKRLSSVL